MKAPDLPNAQQFEITVIGTGGGYGESIICHLGNRDWIVIDSCTDPRTGEILPLEYLKEIGVNVSTEVKLIVCTHWDDDHIRGISDILRECKNAKFCISNVTDRKKFLQFVSLDYEKLDKIGSKSSTKEFIECLEIMDVRGIPIIQASQDRNIFSSTVSGNRVEVFSLSPSDESMRLFDHEISRLISEFGDPNKKLIQTSNQKSVALLLKLGNHRAILGADLEFTISPKTGWTCIISTACAIDGTASYIKIPHHGSQNGYHTDLWDQLMSKDNPEATLTPWNRNDRLPQPGMVAQYKKHTANLYITSNITSSGPKRRSADMEKAIERLGFKPREIRFYKGIIRSRIAQAEKVWDTRLFAAAEKL